MSEVVSFSTYLDAVSLALFERLGGLLVKVFELDRSLRSAGVYIHPTLYACRVLLYTLASAFTSVIIFVTLLTLSSPPLIIAIIYLLSMIFVPIVVFALGVTYPSILTSLRKLFVDSELPFFLAYLATMTKGGVSVEVSIAKISELRVFKYIGAEAGRIIRQIKVFGYDPITAIERVVREHPSNKFRDIMLGYVATLRAGGDLVHYLETRTRETLANRVSEVKSLVDRLAIYLELYIVLGVIVSLTVFTFFAVSGSVAAIGGPRMRGLGIDPIIPLIYNTVILPALGITTLTLIHLSHPRTSLPHRLPYIFSLASLPISILSSLFIIIVGESWNIFEGVVTPKGVPISIISVTIGLLIPSVVGWVTYSGEMRGTKGLTQSLAYFLRDLSEVRKSGLSPEKCFIVLSERYYGNLTKIIRKATTALAIGISLDKALARAMRAVKDWFLAVIFRFLVDSVLVGGGSPEVMDSLANFAQGLAESEVELRSRLKAYVILPYFGAIMVSSSPIIVIWQLTSTSVEQPASNVMASLALTLSLGAIVNSYLMGLIAGKVSNLTIAAGFKHSTIMVTISAVVILLMLNVLKIV